MYPSISLLGWRRAAEAGQCPILCIGIDCDKRDNKYIVIVHTTEIIIILFMTCDRRIRRFRKIMHLFWIFHFLSKCRGPNLLLLSYDGWCLYQTVHRMCVFYIDLSNQSIIFIRKKYLILICLHEQRDITLKNSVNRIPIYTIF